MIDQKKITVSDTSDPSPGSSYRSPAPAGVAVKTMIERGHAYLVPKLYNVEITLLEIVRGEVAWERVKDQGVSEQPENDFEYILARIHFRYLRRIRGGEDEPYKLPEGQFVAVAEDGITEYKAPSVSQYFQPALVGHTFQPGESCEGWILLQAPKDSKKPLLIYKRQHVEGMHGIWSYLWFQLFKLS